MPHSYTASQTLVHDYLRDGAVVLRGVLSAEEVKTLAQGIEYNLAHLSPLAQVASQPDDSGRFVEDFCTWQSNPRYGQIMRHSALPAVAAQLMQSNTVRIYHDHLLVKEPGTRQPTPWHQVYAAHLSRQPGQMVCRRHIGRVARYRCEPRTVSAAGLGIATR